MKTHAVPQEIMSVEFKLFGNFLSIREFVFIASGIGIAYFFYLLMQGGILPPLLALPCILVFGAGGIAIGLVPIQERSLDQWIVNYLAAIRRPTRRVWKKANFSTAMLPTDDDTMAGGIATKHHIIPTPAQQQGIFQPSPTDQTTEEEVKVEKIEAEEMKHINDAFQQVEVTTNKAANETAKVTSPPSALATQTQPPKQNLNSTDQSNMSEQTASSAKASTIKMTAASKKRADKPSSATPIQTQKTPAAKQPAQPKQPVQQNPTPQPARTSGPSNAISITDDNVNEYKTDVPGIENKPNTINIVVKDANSQILQGIVCVIKNTKGDPVRASISNTLGQVINNIPLESGTYKINLSKQGYIFPEITRVLTGKTYPPIEIKSL